MKLGGMLREMARQVSDWIAVVAGDTRPNLDTRYRVGHSFFADQFRRSG